jgi:ATP-dependent Clp protease adaptor protein ClpS
MSTSSPDVIVKKKTSTSHKVQKPKRYNVILHNDDKSTFEFVIAVLIQIFGKTMEEAEEITYSVHVNGSGVAGTFSQEVADEKTNEVHILANHYGYPLKATSEPEN